MGQWHIESELGQPSLDNLLEYLKKNAKHFNKNNKIEVKPQQRRQAQRKYSGGSCDHDDCEM